MAPLKDLEREYPVLDSNFRNFCASHGIFSVEDFLVHDLYVLVAFAEQQPTSERLKEGITVVLSIIDGMHQPWLNGMQLLEDALRNKNFLTSGLEEMDMFLHGGFRVGQLTELVGPSSSGKTQVCLQVASNVARKYNGSVVYLDTGNSFSPQRIAQTLGQSSDPANSQVKYQNLQNIMGNIFCQSVFDIFGLFDALHQLQFQLKSQNGKGDCQARLLIVDSVSSLITPVLGGNGSQGRALMVAVGFLLKKLAHEHNLTVLVTNHTVAGEGGICKPALGESWKSIPHVRLLLHYERGSNICKISILKHPSMASGKAARFVIPPDSDHKGEPGMKRMV
ncbi:hypothetical protein SLA2020_375060 [Shorea laevis]